MVTTVSSPSVSGVVLRGYQRAAVDAVLTSDTNRGVVVMACGTGKTIVAGEILYHKTPPGGVVLFLVPSIALIEQLYHTFTNVFTGWDVYAVCSHVGVTEDISVTELTVEPTTNPDTVQQWVTNRDTARRSIILCTYQSIEVITELYANNSNLIFDAIVFDEAHHTVGDASKLFTTALVDVNVPARYRLFLTATPKITRTNHDLDETTVVSMDNTALYGPVLYTYSLPQAISEGTLSEYRIAVIGIPEKSVPTTAEASYHGQA